MNKKLTPWFPAGTRPARQGVYEVMDHGPENICYSRWTGDQWMFRHYSLISAERADQPSYTQYATWRGLAKKP